jgi:hypothetical protein
MKIFVFLIFALLICGFAHSQKLELKILSNGGGLLSNASVKMTYTIGEPVTGKILNGANILSQGFQQTWKITHTSLQELPAEHLKIKAFPNPTQDIINLSWEADHSEAMMIDLIDLNGKTLFRQTIGNTTNEKQINLADYPEGIYILKINAISGKQLGIFKILKTN